MPTDDRKAGEKDATGKKPEKAKAPETPRAAEPLDEKSLDVVLRDCPL
jgi:hypothetical protein